MNCQSFFDLGNAGKEVGLFNAVLVEQSFNLDTLSTNPYIHFYFDPEQEEDIYNKFCTLFGTINNAFYLIDDNAPNAHLNNRVEATVTTETGRITIRLNMTGFWGNIDESNTNISHTLKIYQSHVSFDYSPYTKKLLKGKKKGNIWNTQEAIIGSLMVTKTLTPPPTMNLREVFTTLTGNLDATRWCNRGDVNFINGTIDCLCNVKDNDQDFYSNWQWGNGKEDRFVWCGFSLKGYLISIYETNSQTSILLDKVSSFGYTNNNTNKNNGTYIIKDEKNKIIRENDYFEGYCTLTNIATNEISPMYKLYLGCSHEPF
ncbi:hypothetical protein [Capnocytophaga sp. oral taxon 323]|jgi:hypothetical protein|uniref:hypothetical protein n=1 Tax=Capnocytophaga sp. oral taxon 323 TaxID=1705617 RepID=UPI0006ADADF5|nr:hypothetical protein [Capnocytophaga sp. oral taxon 323]ALC97843.1 hypothetical protein AM608_09445 [Capnocytophaga sp. oral taxon 323]